MIENFDLANFLIQKRRALNMTQKEVALETGLTPAYISLLEKKERKPSAATIKKLAKPLRFTHQEYMNLIEYIAKLQKKDDSSPLSKQNPNPITKEFDITELTDEDIHKIEEYIELLKIKNKYKQKKD
ncbi:helix-turn-helix domain-containing protein [Bacillus altitudinis]|uniref:helix-turn-helix domain-containing protein n=1 Tax=Bacillus altitudinis TaxID=293387 RepID=UPI0029436F03|nr:helix-turn-helix transcriptional regulator [Bacillus altitudinis]WOI43363.1 helix-turn-helix transcriptional regulator [Bacillus altitudinis]